MTAIWEALDLATCYFAFHLIVFVFYIEILVKKSIKISKKKGNLSCLLSSAFHATFRRILKILQNFNEWEFWRKPFCLCLWFACDNWHFFLQSLRINQYISSVVSVVFFLREYKKRKKESITVNNDFCRYNNNNFRWKRCTIRIFVEKISSRKRRF